MSLYYWNTYAERRNAFTMVNSIGNIIRDDNSISSMSSDNTDLDDDVSLNSIMPKQVNLSSGTKRIQNRLNT